MKVLQWVLVAATLAGCRENAGPGGTPDSRLNIVRLDTLAPPILALRDSFWAKVEDGREMRLFYQGATPGDSGEEFLRLEVPGDALYRKPNGSAFQTGDSILITVTVVDATRFLFHFEPAGLRFNTAHPARLKVSYSHGEHDFDGDGTEDPDDVEIEHQLDLWYRTAPGALWFRTGSVKFELLDDIDANILSFSQYAVAW